MGSHQNILAYFTPEGAILSDGLSGPAYGGDLYFIALRANDPIGHMFVSEHRIGCCDSLTQYDHQHGQHLAEMETQIDEKIKSIDKEIYISCRSNPLPFKKKAYKRQKIKR